MRGSVTYSKLEKDSECRECEVKRVDFWDVIWQYLCWGSCRLKDSGRYQFSTTFTDSSKGQYCRVGGPQGSLICCYTDPAAQEITLRLSIAIWFHSHLPGNYCTIVRPQIRSSYTHGRPGNVTSWDHVGKPDRRYYWDIVRQESIGWCYPVS